MRLRSESVQIRGEFGEAVPRGKARVIAVFFGMLNVTLCGLWRRRSFYALLTALPFAASFRNKEYAAILTRCRKHDVTFKPTAGGNPVCNTEKRLCAATPFFPYRQRLNHRDQLNAGTTWNCGRVGS
jgi:hypothetical protein